MTTDAAPGMLPDVVGEESLVAANAAESVVENLSNPYMASSATGTATIAVFTSRRSTTSFMTSGTATFASFAETRNTSAIATRQRYSST